MAKARPNSEQPDDSKKPQSGAALLVALVGGCVAVLGFWTNYGMAAVGFVILAWMVLAVLELRWDESPYARWRRRHKKSLIWATIGFGCLVGVPAFVFGLINTYRFSDLLRGEFRAGPIERVAYAGSAAPWARTPPPGTGSEEKTAFDVAGWKRLINSAIVNDPQNKSTRVRELLYIESVPFDKGYHTFNAEIELPTNVHIDEIYGFLVADRTTRSSRHHERLQSIHAEVVGVDRNRGRLIVSSPDSGERIQVYVVARSKVDQQPFPKDVESNVILRSIK